MNASALVRTACYASGMVAVLATATVGQAPRAVSDAVNDIDESKFKYLGTEIACRRCHEEGPKGNDKTSGVTDRVQLTEWTTWSKADKHAQAFRMLKESRGQRIAELMQKNVFSESTGCIQCHTANVNLAIWDSKCGSEDIETNSCVSEGVSCEACHGPASEWVGPHTLGDWWEKTDREKADIGFLPIRNPLYRAELCLSCHVGNARENKVITHEMYAAGHPPLSGFELESFANKMPRHWRQSYEKPQAVREYQRTRNMLIANVVSLRLAVELAAADVAANRTEGRWPELARFECYSCHHNLQLPSWRQSRGDLDRRVGQSRLNLGCEPLVRAAAHAALGETGRQEADALLKRVQSEVFDGSFFGNEQAIARINPIVQKWCLELESKLMAVPLTTTKVVDVLDEIYRVSGQELRDYDTARQLTGAIIILCDELAKIDSDRSVPQPMVKQLERLRKGFNLHEDSLRQIEETLNESLRRRAGFKPGNFARLISRLKQYPRE